MQFVELSTGSVNQDARCRELDDESNINKGKPMRKYLLLAAVAALPAMVMPAIAANSSANFTAKIKIVAGCNVAANDINFPDTSVISGAENANSTVTVRCTKTTPYALSLSNQTVIANVTTSFSGVMTSPAAETISYKIGFVGVSSGTGSGADQTYTMKGTVDVQNTPSPGTYTDARTIYVVY